MLAIGDRLHEAGRAYVQIDNQRLLRLFSSRLAASGGEVVVGSARSIVDGRVELDGGGSSRRIDVDVVVDATGGTTPFVSRIAGGAARQAMQCAHGIVAEIEGMPNPGAATLMDWTGPDRRDPSFLYALDYGGGTWLVEETSLAHRPGLADDELERRLRARLRMIGAHIISVQRIERVRFAMDSPMPVVPQPVVGVGAAASIVHPATGYSVAAALRMAPLVADAIVASPGDRAVAAWAAVWPAERVAARRLETYGMERLLTMDQRLTRQFFDTFFTLGRSDQAAYLGGQASAKELAAVMWKVFAAAPMRLRRALATGNPLTLARSFLG